MSTDDHYQARMKIKYRETAIERLIERFSYSSKMQVPRLEKIVLSMGVGDAVQNSKLLDAAASELTLISGQKAVKTKAKKSIAGFKVRKGMEIGAVVTLRGTYMFEFLDRFINIAIPRIKDFRGVNPNAFDGRGNYSIGIEEQIIFPEIDYDSIERINGLNVAIVTSAPTDREARSLLEELGMPFWRS